MDYIDNKYIGFVGVRLQNFKKKGKALWNFRCPICGDSLRDKTKARGYIFETPENKVMMKCHNCSASMGFSRFLETVDPNMKKEYALEKFGNKKRVKDPSMDSFFKSTTTHFEKSKHNHMHGVVRLDKLPDDHQAIAYFNSRMIPKEHMKRLYWSDSFKKWTNTIVKNKFKGIKFDEPRLIIPFFSEEGDLIAFQGRTLDPKNELRYITIKVDESVCKLYGLDKMNTTKPVYVLEGPIDSMFIPNAIAMAGSDMAKTCVLDKNAEFVIVMDNENRNKEIIHRIQQSIDDGFSVCIWDKDIKQKDVNDMVLSGMTKEYIMESIKRHTYKGLQATMALNKWKRI